MKKIRIGNDFVFNWAIERGGLPEDLSSVLEAKLTASVFGKKQDIPFTVSGNIITIEFTPEICNVIGPYNLLFTYILPDTGLSDEDRKCAIDVDAFHIVAKTAQADDSTEFSVTSDMAIAFKGDKGDSAYQVWLDAGNTGTEEDYFNWLQKPATDIAETVNLQEQARVEAEELRVQAESLRVEAEILRQANTRIAITNAEDATLNANTAAQNADDAREAIQSDLGAKAFHGYASIEVAKTLKQVEDNTSVKMTNLVVNGGFESGVPSWSGIPPILSEEEKLSGDSSGYVNGNPSVSYSIIDIDCNLNDRLYVSIARKFKSVSSITAHRVAISNYGSLSGITNFDVFYKGNLNIWEVTSSIVNGRTGGIRLVAGFLSSTVAEFFVDNFIVINLTETFGKGSEPTQEEFDLLLDILGIEYFEGEITIPAQKVMQWQLALIRKNKNAIIALGGTII